MEGLVQLLCNVLHQQSLHISARHADAKLGMSAVRKLPWWHRYSKNLPLTNRPYTASTHLQVEADGLVVHVHV